ncbi:peptidase C14, caspase catalytic subunit p20 [Azospirillum sp. Vi22]|nr:peptidase C14, caspase catalytic subunit p20 [Azospirillum baldaniorum]
MLRLRDPDLDEKSLRPYFQVNPERSGPFSPAVEINPETVEFPADPATAGARSALAMNAANWWCRMRRRIAFDRRIASGYSGPIIVSEGDSWFQYPILLDDVIDHLGKDYAILSLDAAGDTLSNMLAEAEYRQAITESNAVVFLFSAGGNDLFGGGALAGHLRRYDPATPNLRPEDYLLPSFDGLIAEAVDRYQRILREVERDFPNVLTVCHGYDRPTPAGGPWLGRPMARRDITAPALQKGIVDVMFDRFNDELARLVRTFSKAVFVDARNAVRTWHDELHPTDEGFAAVAALFSSVIVERTAFSSRVATTPGTLSAVRSSTRTLASSPTKPTHRGRIGLSLHIGLNSVDTTHYDGWEGVLGACENDAADMHRIAADQGFHAATVLTADATRSAVLKIIESAASELHTGDMFLVTYSGHGGQVPDFNSDEEDKIDETWCLFDGQLVDDEMYQLWSKFEEGVRILVISDSCHSGTVTRVALSPLVTVAPERGAAILYPHRAMPYPVAQRVAQKNRDFYSEIARKLPWGDESVLRKELTNPLRCTVRLLSGCQDNQLSYDGMLNGQFTEALLKAWDSGRFQGTYEDFHQRISQFLWREQTPNHSVIGQQDLLYDRQRPFEI